MEHPRDGRFVLNAERTNDVAMLRAAEVTLAAGKERFRVSGGEGIGFQAREDTGMKVMRGSIQITLLDDKDKGDADTYDAAEVANRLRPLLSGG